MGTNDGLTITGQSERASKALTPSYTKPIRSQLYLTLPNPARPNRTLPRSFGYFNSAIIAHSDRLSRLAVPCVKQ